MSVDDFPKKLTCAIGGTVVHNDDLFIDSDGLNTKEYALNVSSLVVDRNDD